MNSEAWRLPRVMVPVLSSSKRVDVAGSFDGASGHGQHVVLNQPVHAGDADGREQSADGGGNQADQQRHQHKDGLRRAGINRERLQRDHRQQKDDGQAGQQDVQRDFVRRLLPLGAFDQRDHAIEECLAGIGRDLDLDLIGEHARAAGHRRAVASGFANHWRRFAGDRGLVHRGDAFDDLAVAGNEFAGGNRHDSRRRAAWSWEFLRSCRR